MDRFSLLTDRRDDDDKSHELTENALRSLDLVGHESAPLVSDVVNETGVQDKTPEGASDDVQALVSDYIPEDEPPGELNQKLSDEERAAGYFTMDDTPEELEQSLGKNPDTLEVYPLSDDTEIEVLDPEPKEPGTFTMDDSPEEIAASLQPETPQDDEIIRLPDGTEILPKGYKLPGEFTLDDSEEEIARSIEEGLNRDK